MKTLPVDFCKFEGTVLQVRREARQGCRRDGEASPQRRPDDMQGQGQEATRPDAEETDLNVHAGE